MWRACNSVSGHPRPAAPAHRSASFRGARLPRWHLAALAAASLGLLGCRNVPSDESAASARSAASGPPWFEDVARASGVDFVHSGDSRGEYLFPEIVTGGAALLDYDGDGLLDLFFVQGGSLYDKGNAAANALYRNLGGGRFEDVTARAGVGGRNGGYGMGCACGDYDNDGDVDLYVACYGPDVLYRNNGDGTFTDVTAEAGVNNPAWGCSAAFADCDGDGLLDLVVANYVLWSRESELKCDSGGRRDYCLPTNYNAPAPDTLFRNLGGGRFADASEAAGLRAAFGNGMGVVTGDFNSDGRMDIFVANDTMPNQCWINQGGGRFLNQARELGCAVNRLGVVEAGMGIALADIGDDGDLDFFVSHLRDETNTLFVNEGGAFDDQTSMSGLGAPGLPFTGFGIGFADFDNDGRLDCYVANGAVVRGARPMNPQDPYAEPNQLFRGIAGHRFEEVLPRGGTAELGLHASRAAVFGDLDNDGGVDVIVANRDAAPYVLRNIVKNRGHWAIFRALRPHGSDAQGAILRIESGGATRVRYAHPAYSYCASSDPRVHVGLGAAARVERVTVLWPNGRREQFGPFEADRIHDLREGSGQPVGG